jgi:hypothetical protein
MKDKEPRPKPKAKDGPTKIAKGRRVFKRAGASAFEARRSPEQIADRIAENKSREAELLELPPTPVAKRPCC